MKIKCSHAAVTSYLKVVRNVVTLKSFKLVLKNRAIAEPREVGGAWYIPDMLGVIEGWPGDDL